MFVLDILDWLSNTLQCMLLFTSTAMHLLGVHNVILIDVKCNSIHFSIGYCHEESNPTKNSPGGNLVLLGFVTFFNVGTSLGSF